MNTKPTRKSLQIAMERAGAAMADHLMKTMQAPDLVRTWDRAHGDYQQAGHLSGTAVLDRAQPVEAGSAEAERASFITAYRLWIASTRPDAHPEMVQAISESHWGRAAGAMWLARADQHDAKLGRYVKAWSRNSGWKDSDAEGAFEYAQRMCYTTGKEDAIDTRAQPVAAGELPKDWVALSIIYNEDMEYPEEVAYGPKRMMDRLGKWLDKYLAMRIAESRADSRPAGGVTDLMTVECPSCQGLGKRATANGWIGCDDCDGQGKIIVSRADHVAATLAASAAQPAPDLLPPMGIHNDRDMLNYLVDAFENEESNCPRCGYCESMANTDSAGFLRAYLAAAPAPTTKDGGPC